MFAAWNGQPRCAISYTGGQQRTTHRKVDSFAYCCNIWKSMLFHPSLGSSRLPLQRSSTLHPPTHEVECQLLRCIRTKLSLRASATHTSCADEKLRACVLRRSFHLARSLPPRFGVVRAPLAPPAVVARAWFGLDGAWCVGWIASRPSRSSVDELEDPVQVDVQRSTKCHMNDAGTRDAHGRTNTNGDRRAEGSAARRVGDADGPQDRTGGREVRASRGRSGAEDRRGGGRHGRVGTCLRFRHSKHRQDGRRLPRAACHPLPGYTNVLR